MPAGAAQEQSVTQPSVKVYTLGTFKVLVGEHAIDEHAWRRKSARQLFKVLLTRPGRRMTRDEAIELFWPESDGEAAASNLRSTLYAMRRALESDVILGDHTSVWLVPDAELWMDAAAFERTVADAWRSPDPLPLLEEASALYVGDYLPDDLFEDWAGDRREALKRTWTELQFGLAQALEARSDVNAALQPLERLLRADPCDERAAQELMKLLTRQDRRAEALRVYQRLAQALREELDVEPSSDTVELQRQIGSGESVAAPPIPAATFRCTYPFPAPSELVGRSAELSTLSKVLSGGRTAGRVAVVGAPAGTGKSALLGQIVRQAQAQGVLCLAGGCYEERGAVPLGPFHDALVDFMLAQPAETIRSQMAAYVEDLAEVIPELRYHLQIGSDEGAGRARDRMRTFGAVHACLRGLAGSGPVLLCLEDLHAADEATLQLLHYLARQTRRLPLVMVATYRDDDAPADEPLAQTLAAMTRERLAQAIALTPLDRNDTQRLLGSLLDGSFSQSLGESLYATTGGNPLFVEQLVLALGETGQLERKEGVWHGTGELHGTPRIVREVIAQRLQRLDASCREMLDTASVLGQSFEHHVILAAMERRDEPSLLRDIDRAITTHVLQDTPGGYTFRHALLRDAVYYALTGPRRMLLHAHAASVLENVYGARTDEHAAEIAHHLALAGESADLRAKLLHYSLIAGRHAEALSAHRQAVVHYTRAYELVHSMSPDDSSDVALDALEGRGRAERQLARWSDAVTTFRHVLEHARSASRRGRARAVLVSALLYHDPTTALAEIEHGLTDLAADRDESQEFASVRLHLQSLMALVWFLNGHYEKLHRLGIEMRDAAQRLDPLSLSRAYSVIAWAHLGRGHLADAAVEYRLALSAAERSGNRIQIAAVHDNLGALQCLSGEFDSARTNIDTAVGIYRQLAGDLPATYALSNLARVWLAEGNLERARLQAEEALSLASEAGIRWEAECRSILGAVHALRTNWEEATLNFERAVTIQQNVGYVAASVESMLGLGRIHEQTGSLGRAQDLYTMAMNAAATTDIGPHIVSALRHIGMLNLRVGNTREGMEQVRNALHLAEDQRMQGTLEWSPTLLAAADVEVESGNTELRIELVDKACAASKTLEQRVESDIGMALARVDANDPRSAQVCASRAVDLATPMQAPRLQGLAYRAVAKAALAGSNSSLALESLHAAARFLEYARTPSELQLVRGELHLLE